MPDLDFADLAVSDRPFTPEEAAGVAARAAGRVDLHALPRTGTGEAVLLWRDEHSEGWLNTWWESRDTGYHDHDGSCVGVAVLAGRASNEALTVGGPRRVRSYGPGEDFSFPGSGIHRMDHDAGAVTVHVYSPPIRSIGSYELVDGELRRTPGSSDDESPPSPRLLAAMEGSV